jgi:putative ABC transport system permease protein
MDEVLDEEVAERRVGTTTLVAFAAFALVLAILGIYGVIAYFVVQHIPEIGVRVALGAQPGDVMRWLVGKGMSLAVAGIAAGTAGGLVTARLIRGLLVGVEGSGLAMCLAAGGILLVLALVASVVPARRALRHDPIAALRAQ